MALVEVCVDSLQSAIAATTGGAHRIEVCENLSIGGVTPSSGLVESIMTQVSTPVRMMIRPRGGNFVYDKTETDQILRSIEIAHNLGVEGIVFGCLNPHDHIDEKLLSKIIKESAGLPITFHRAIDESSDIISSLQLLLNMGIGTILTSGGAPSVVEGIATLEQMIGYGNHEVVIMPGAGLRDNNIESIHAQLHAQYYHGSFRNIITGMCDAAVVRTVVQIVA